MEISLVEVYERVGRSVIYFGLYNDLKRLQKDLFYGCEKVAKIFWFCYFFSTLLKSVHCEQLKGMRSSKIGMCKWYHLSREGIRKGYFFFQKRYIIKGEGVGPRGGASLYKTYSTPEPVPPRSCLWTSLESFNNSISSEVAT